MRTLKQETAMKTSRRTLGGHPLPNERTGADNWCTALAYTTSISIELHPHISRQTPSSASELAMNPAMTWTPYEGYLYTLSWNAAREFEMSLSSALLRVIASCRFVIQSRTDWPSKTIHTLLGDSSIWIIGNAYVIAFILA